MSLSAEQIREQATALLKRLPAPNISKSTTLVYDATFRRMLVDETVDPLRAGDARDTYNVRRAALLAGTWRLLRFHLSAYDQATKRGDSDTAERALSVLARVVERCGPAIDRDPPKPMKSPDWSKQPSRWADSGIPHPRRGKGSKKHILGSLPADWMMRVWQAAGTDWAYLDALAVHMLTPVRPAEFVPGWRNGRDVPGVAVALVGAMLLIAVAPVKSHDGKYGTGETTIRLSADHPNPAVQHLVKRCRTARRGAIAVRLEGTNGMRKALERLGRRALGPDAPKITGYVYRNQLIADYKATLGAGVSVAAAAGHCTDRTQSRYGRVEHGRRRGELVGVIASRTPRIGDIERTRLLRSDPAAVMRR